MPLPACPLLIPGPLWSSTSKACFTNSTGTSILTCSSCCSGMLQAQIVPSTIQLLNQLLLSLSAVIVDIIAPATSNLNLPEIESVFSTHQFSPRVNSRSNPNPATRPFVPAALFSFFDGAISLPQCSQIIAQHLPNSSSHVRTAAQEFTRTEGALSPW